MWAVVLCDFPGAESPRDPQWYVDLFAAQKPGLGHYWTIASYGALTITADVHGWYTLPRPHSFYEGDPDAPTEQEQLKKTDLIRDCQAAADEDVDFSAYDGIVHSFNGPFNEGANPAFGGPTTLWVDDPGAIRPNVLMSDPSYWTQTTFAAHPEAVVAHEMGHGFGFEHSGVVSGGEYGSDWDLMSNIGPHCLSFEGPCEAVHPIAHWKRFAGWIPDEVVFKPLVGTSTTVALSPLARGLPEEGYVMAEIPYRGRSETFFTVEARNQENYDALLPHDAVLVHLANTKLPQIHLNTSADGDPTDEGIVEQGGYFFHEDSGVRVSFIGKNEDGSFNVEITQPERSTRHYPRRITFEVYGTTKAWRLAGTTDVRVLGGPVECRGGWVSIHRKTRQGWDEIKRVPVGYGHSSFYFPRGRSAAFRAVALPYRIGWDVCDRAVSATVRR